MTGLAKSNLIITQGHKGHQILGTIKVSRPGSGCDLASGHPPSASRATSYLAPLLDSFLLSLVLLWGHQFSSAGLLTQPSSAWLGADPEQGWLGAYVYTFHLQFFRPYFSSPKMVVKLSFSGAARNVIGSEHLSPNSVIKKVMKDPRLGFHLPLIVLLTLELGADILLIGGEVGRTGSFLFRIWTELDRICSQEVPRSSLKEHLIVFTSKIRARQLAVQKVRQQPCVPKV